MIINRRNLLFGTAGALLSCALPAWAIETQVIGGPAFGSWWRAVLPAGLDTREIKIAIEAVILSVDDAMSPFKKSSEISRLNGVQNTNWHSVSHNVSKVITESLRIARLTDGAFDPTIGPIVGRYGYGPITGTSPAGYQSIEINEANMRKTIPDASLDLCGIAKGHALDRMADVLTTRGLNAFLLEAGGEVLASGLHPNGRQWHAAIETPHANPRAFQRIVKLNGMALATSGNAVNGGQEGDISFSHIINPLTELPITNGVASVSVIAATAMKADALATGFMVMGRERGLALAEEKDIPAMFLMQASSGIWESMSTQFAQYIVV